MSRAVSMAGVLWGSVMWMAPVPDRGFWQRPRGPTTILFRAQRMWDWIHSEKSSCENGVSHRCACVKLSSKAGYRAILGGARTSLTRHRAIWGITAITSQRARISKIVQSCLKFWRSLEVSENPRVRKIFVRNSGAGNGCANFMDAWKNAFFLQEKKKCP